MKLEIFALASVLKFCMEFVSGQYVTTWLFLVRMASRRWYVLFPAVISGYRAAVAGTQMKCGNNDAALLFVRANTITARFESSQEW